MPQPLTHYLVYKKALMSKLPSLWESHPHFAGLGSFSPDLFYIQYRILPKRLEYTAVSDVVHWNGSLDCFCSMLDYIKNQSDASVQAKLKAFAYGFYSHVITDCLFHPFIYRKTKDHWMEHQSRKSTKNFLAHKRLESIIDFHILDNETGLTPLEFGYPHKILCYDYDQNTLLDQDLFNLINHYLGTVIKPLFDDYHQIINKSKFLCRSLKKVHNGRFEEFFPNSNNDDNHPIHEAYNMFILSITVLYSWKWLTRIPFNWLIKLRVPCKCSILKKLKKLQVLVPLTKLTPKKKEKYINHLHKTWTVDGQLNYSVDQLFNLAVCSVERVIALGESFLNVAEAESAAQYFKGKNVDFLDQNYNLDTGLPSEPYAEPSDYICRRHAKRFRYKVDFLINRYKYLTDRCVKAKDL